MDVITRHLIITGHVQGVFYRNWARSTALDLELNGWVRNRPDGSVEAMIQGEAAAVERFIELAHDGPPSARVARVMVTEAQSAAFSRFEKRATG